MKLFPIVVYTKSLLPENINGRNWPFFVLMKKGIKHQDSVEAQEISESRYKTHPIRMLYLKKKQRIEMELLGKAIEWVHAVKNYNTDSEYKLKEEAMSLTGYKLFKWESLEKLEKAISGKKELAEKWLSEYKKPLFIFNKEE